MKQVFMSFLPANSQQGELHISNNNNNNNNNNNFNSNILMRFFSNYLQTFTIYKSKNDNKTRNHNLRWYSTKF